MLVPVVAPEIHALAAKLATRSDDIRAARRLPADVVEMLRAAGAFRIAQPRALGGPELSPREQTEVVEVLSRAEPSCGWCVMIGSDAPYYGAYMEPSAAKELWPSLDDITAGQLTPNGRAQRVDGGWLVNGRWSFGSGSTHADVIVGGCLSMDGDAPRLVDGAPELLVACAPASSWTVLDNWHTTGMEGSGSNDYTATDLFVPDRHVFRFRDEVHRPEPLYRWPGMFFINMAGVPLGIARRAIDIAIAVADEKLLVPEMVMMRDTSRARLAIADAEAQYGAARAYVFDALDRFWAMQSAGEVPDRDVRVAVGLSRAHSFRVARDITIAMGDLVGGGSVYRSHPIEPLVRDAVTLCQHIVAQTRMFEMLGELRLTGRSVLPLL
jgi:alkylation response protein AidB-like acyl-CoA dehydrogenase